MKIGSDLLCWAHWIPPVSTTTFTRRACAVFVAGVVALNVPLHSQSSRPTPARPVLDPASAFLRATRHPAVPRELDQIWLAPPGATGVVSSSVTSTPLAQAVRQYSSGQYELALATLSTSSLPSRALDPYVRYYTAMAELRLRRPESARRRLAPLNAAGISGALPDLVSFAEGEAAEMMGDLAGAERIYQQLTGRAPIAADAAWFKLGVVRRARGNQSGATSAFARVYYDFPLSRFASEASAALEGAAEATNTARVLPALGRAERLMEARRFSEARRSLQRVRSMARPYERESIDLKVAECAYHLRDFAAARARLTPYLRRGRYQEEARFFDLMSVRGLGRHDQFARLTRQFVLAFPRSSRSEEALNALAVDHVRRNEDVPALQLFREMLARFPGGRFGERAAWQVGWSALRQSRPADAAATFERAAATYPRSDLRPAYLYWAGRAREDLRQFAAARARYTLARTDYLYSYYGRLAEQALERPGIATATPPTAASPSSADAPQTPAAADAATLSLIRELLNEGLLDDAQQEILFAERRWGNSPVLQATQAWIHNQQGQVRLGITSMKRAYPQFLSANGAALAPELWSVIFPVAYWDLINERAMAEGLDPFVVVALIAQESTFAPDSRSAANAVGLMQLLPTTAQRAAHAIGAPFAPTILTTPEGNIRLGTAHLRGLVKQFGEMHLALAAYNAGERRLRTWRETRQHLSREEFIDDIPFPETRSYVKAILGASENYRRLYGENAVLSLDGRRIVPALASRHHWALACCP
jgi:soluble lytic murein transglycosylase